MAAPSSYHEFTGPEPLAYDGPGTDAGNEWKITKTVEAYDEDATLSIDTLLELPTCNGRVGATGMLLVPRILCPSYVMFAVPIYLPSTPACPSIQLNHD